MKSRLPSAPGRFHWIGLSLLGALALSVPAWIDPLAEEEPPLRPVADILTRDEPGRIAPDRTEDGLRRRLEELPVPLPESALQHRTLQAAPHGDGQLLAPPLPRDFDPEGPFGH